MEQRYVGIDDLNLLPFEPVYSIETSAMLLLCRSKARLRRLLFDHKSKLSEPQYIRRNHGRKERVLTASDLRTLREITIKTEPYRTGRWTGRGQD